MNPFHSFGRSVFFMCRHAPALCLGLACLWLSACAHPSKNSTHNLLGYCTFALSADGNKLAYPVPGYDKDGDFVTEFWIANLDGSGKKLVGSHTGNWSISWRGDASLIGVDRFSARVTVLSIDNGACRDMSFTDRYNPVFVPIISPDGTLVASGSFNGLTKKSVFIVLDTKTGVVKELSSDLVKSPVAWAPDAKKIIYGAGDYQRHYALKILDALTGAVTNTGLDGVGPAFSPDGKWVAYTGNVLRGGSWMAGIPTDGRIIITCLETKESRILSEEPVNASDEKTKKWELLGAISPAWSPDGTKIAFRRIHVLTQNNEKKINKDEIWVVNVDGAARKKIASKWGPFVWAPDGKAIMVKTETAITRFPIDGGKGESVVTWKAANPPKFSKADFKTETTNGAEVCYAGIKPDYARAILALAAEARNTYVNKFGCSMPDKVVVKISKGDNTQLWTDGQSAIFLEVDSHASLQPPMQSGVFNIFGICHELGHMAMYRRLNYIGLPAGVAEAWSTYAGSVVVDEVYKKLGPNLWPEPYNYSEVEGLERIKKAVADPKIKKSSYDKAIAMFYALHEQYGATNVFAGLNAATVDKPYGKDLMPRFVDALVKITGDQSVRGLVPAEFMTSMITWKVADRQITDETVKGLVSVKDKTGLLLKYDDGTSEGYLSSAGSGHAVVFKAPDGSWAVDSIQVYAQRYGSETPPDFNFTVFICDGDFNVIKAIEKPYSIFERSKPKWYTIDFTTVKVPQTFYVCIFFEPTYTRGIYMHEDKNVAISHSKSALPWTFVSDVDGKFDWMIRTHLRKSP